MLTKVQDDDRCIGCPMCRLFPDNTLVSPQVGESDVLFIGEAPGESEQLTGRPFAGGAGRWLDSALKKARIKRDDVNIINVIQCRPPENIFLDASEAKSYISRAEASEAIDRCLRKHVKPFIASRNWSKIVFLGEKALRYIAGLSGGIFKWRGSPLEVSIDDKIYKAIATLHPSYIIRDQNMFPVMANDMCKSLIPPPEHYDTHPTLETVRNFTATEFAFDIETVGWSKKISMVGLSDKPYHAIVVPFEGDYINELRRIFMNAEKVIGHNAIAFDLPILLPQLGLEWSV